MKPKVIVLDFDGVIVESVGIKDRAFEQLFKDYPDCIEEIMEYHLSHNATVRFEKFKHITENILRRNYTKETEENLSQRFSHLVFNNIIECPYVAGAEDFLEYFYKKIPLYVASASPERELREIIEARGLGKYFKRIYAIPWVKKGIIQDILADEDISPMEAAFIGDSPEDYMAAQETGVFFVGRYSNKSFNKAAIPIYKDLFEIKHFLCRRIVRCQAHTIP